MTRNRLMIISRWLMLLAVSALFAGCLSKQSPPVTYYSLLSMEQLGTAAKVQAKSDLHIGIGPIIIPEALKRTQLVTRDDRNIYQFDEFNRWAGVLENDIAVVLGDNLGDLIGTETIAFFPWISHFSPTHRVIIAISQLDGELTGEATLNARWSIADGEGKTTLASGKSTYRQPVEGGDYAGLVKAESLLLADLSKELAQAIKSLPGQK
jgi:uncharacterized lipoprotein YmbA